MTTAISAQTAEKIRAKAETNTPLLDATPEKQQMYDAYQANYVNQITQKAQAGEQLMRPNAWKDEIYNNAQAQHYSPQQIMGRQQDGNADHMASLEQMLRQGADATYGSQKAILDATLNQQLTDLQMALEEAVANGEMSIREAHAAFEENKKNIEKQAYQDSEMTQLHSQSRGIQNSQQMLGLMQGDNARRDSLINTNVTERDRRVADVKDRLNMIKNQSKLQMASASAQHGYGLAGARGQADAQMYQNMFNMNFDDYKMNREQQFALDKGQLDHVNNKQLQAQQQAYTLENMNLQQRYTLEQFATQHGYKLGEMSVEQTYRLAQMAQQNGYDVGILGMQQGFQAGQNALDRSHSWGMQQSQQEWQSGEKFLDRMHDMDMLTEKGRVEGE